jgi:hypothetical protein
MAFLLILCLLPLCGFAPGFFLLRRAQWSPLEKFCGSIGLSLILIYLVFWGAFCAGLPAGPVAWLSSAACAVLGWLARRDIQRLFRNSAARRSALALGALAAWTLLALSMIRVYSGAGWSGDWMEHFQRSLFILHGFPADSPIIGGYILPARPPLMNALCGFFMAQVGDEFAVFQVVSTLLNALAFLPCCLLLPALAGKRGFHGKAARAPYWILAALFALNPMVIQNATYSWTKALTAFYVLLALSFYLSGWRKRSAARILAAFVALSAGLLGHYSAGPYVVFLTLHYVLWLFWRRPQKWRELAGVTLVCGLLLATWFGWSLAQYGVNGTFKSNTSVTSAQSYKGSAAARVGGNIVDTVIPALLRHPAALAMFQQGSGAGALRDKFFIFYQVNVVFAMGLVGGPLVLCLLFRTFREKRKRSGAAAERVFWILLIPFCVATGIAVAGERDEIGLAHLTLLPIAMLGLTLIAGWFPLPRKLFALVLAGCALDFSLGILLQERVQSQENSPQHTVFSVELGPGGVMADTAGPDALSRATDANWVAKHHPQLARQWGAEVSAYQPRDEAGRQVKERLMNFTLAAMGEDETYFHGWWERHQNKLDYLGDRVAGALGDAFEGLGALMVFLFLLIAGGLARINCPAALPAIGPRAPSRKQPKTR